ncbi:hypothetical protein [Pseudoalteromonas sp. MMG005]|uniref:hypothetical protein n=1 Tax=Pseudoalteromonas sp. MMG005 TaxID=2822682 RepID=UPI001B3A657D|nr:hypothetical protein [Pseudoalteromonas sp. MMG005]MBQ4845944.1 hypothetical protein [Pseudoalteromonas sp. MMG005]
MGLNQLTSSELMRLGERIKSVLKLVLTELSPHVHSINSMTQFLSYHRSNSQRIFNAQKSTDGHQVLCALPGVKAFEEFIDKSKPYISTVTYEKLSKAHLLYAQAIACHATSHADLKRQLDAMHTKHAPSKSDNRAQVYYAAKSLLGFSVEHVCCSYILTVNQTNPNFLQEVAMISKLGISRTQEAAPFVQFYSHPHPSDFNKPTLITHASRIIPNEFSMGIVERYSSSGLYDAYSSYSVSNSGMVFDDIPNNDTTDATFIFNNPDELVNPLTHSSQCTSTSISIKNPAKKLTLLVFVDKKINATSNVKVGCYHGNQKVDEGKLNAADMWTERLPDFPQLQVVSLESPQNYITEHPELAEKIGFLLNYSELDDTHFACYAMEVEFPIWSSTYRIYFEHSE